MSIVPTSLAARIVLASLLLGCQTAAVAQPFTASIPEVTAMVKARNDVRGLVLDVKERFNASDPEYLRAKKLYREAYGSYDAWTTVLGAGIVAGAKQDLRSDKGYKETAEAARLAGAKFSNYAESLMGPSKSLTSIVSIVTAAVDLGIKLWNNHHNAAIQDRKELADYIAGHAKWEEWEAIKPEKESPAAKSTSGTAAAGGAQQTGLPQSIPPKRWALVAGVGAYDDTSIVRLHGDDDAKDFAAALRDRAGFPGDHIVLLAGQDADDCRLAGAGRARERSAASASPSRACVADRTNLVNNLYQLARQVPEDGLFIFYFSGHGGFVDGESLLYTSDVRSGSDSYVKQQGLSAGILAEGIRSNHIKRVLIFLDACRNQLLLTKGTQEERTPPEFATGFDLEQLHADVEAFMTFFSSKEGSASYEDPRVNRSYFTAELVRALDGDPAAYDARKALTLASLIHFVQSRVKSRVEEERRANQVPDYQLRGFLADELVLARLP